ncbi:hypothetical protein [Lederbergia lenta]|uniref:hypothetical protein n=1 Tax=Lederbergia lenta TaxID=1467 RepID=UPI00203E293B|nr:hypothetical protein [Lederbergia lenta]MCM3109875.1 hypothetical protein [Lederbergia lenta]
MNKIPFTKRRKTTEILVRYRKQDRFETLEEYMTYMKTGIEDGWIESSNKELKIVYYMLDNMPDFENKS